MQIILLSGGSGKRLWPLSNGTRSKQFLQLLQSPHGEKESMVQRVLRQINEAALTSSVTIATSESQRDSIESQLGTQVEVVTELTFIEVQMGNPLIEEDIERFDWDWDKQG